MERASLHEALAPCGTLATVAPRTGADGRAETFAAALERVLPRRRRNSGLPRKTDYTILEILDPRDAITMLSVGAMFVMACVLALNTAMSTFFGLVIWRFGDKLRWKKSESE